MFVTADETLRIFMLKPSAPFSRGFLTPDWHRPVISPASALGGWGRRRAPPAPVRLERKVQAELEQRLCDCGQPCTRAAEEHPALQVTGPSWPEACLALGNSRP